MQVEGGALAQNGAGENAVAEKGAPAPLEQRAMEFLEKRESTEGGADGDAEETEDASDKEGEEEEKETDEEEKAEKKKRPSGAQRRGQKAERLERERDQAAQQAVQYKQQLGKIAIAAKEKIDAQDHQIAVLKAQLEVAMKKHAIAMQRFEARGSFLEEDDEMVLSLEDERLAERQKSMARDRELNALKEREEAIRAAQEHRASMQKVQNLEQTVNKMSRQYGFGDEDVEVFRDEIADAIRLKGSVDVDLVKIADRVSLLREGMRRREENSSSVAQIARSGTAPRSLHGRTMTFSELNNRDDSLTDRMMRFVASKEG